MKNARIVSPVAVFAAAFFTASCSAPPKQKKPEVEWNTRDTEEAQPAGSSTDKNAPPPITVEAACARFRKLSDEECEWTARFPPDFKSGTSCETSLATWVAPETANHENFERTIRCWALDCAPAVQCMVNAQSGRSPPKPRKCGDSGTAPIEVDAETWAVRSGANTQRFSEVQTSVAEPVEVCGIDSEVKWMTEVTCDDGSNPYGSIAEANDRRDGWFENGGRCNSVLDRYTVACPEATYTIHVDRYICPAAQ
jgi:hypothetical protein